MSSFQINPNIVQMSCYALLNSFESAWFSKTDPAFGERGGGLDHSLLCRIHFISLGHPPNTGNSKSLETSTNIMRSILNGPENHQNHNKTSQYSFDFVSSET
mmetsp:Transcript_62839/g.73487  ORF Transcript_62839/g.73487 Transcript_62839/m.73487 type:complete len:102 (-) Transcript_62839:60-365(-)